MLNFKETQFLRLNSMANPLLNSFLPLFYISWFDDVLTETEMKTMKDAIDSQDWLTKTDKDELFSKIDVENPPSRSQINQWKAIISKFWAEKICLCLRHL